MKKLILPLIFLSLPSLAFGQKGQEIFDAEDAKQIVSKIKDIEVEEMLNKTSEFKKCRDLNPFKTGEKSNPDNIKKAEDCFKKELNNTKNAQKLTELSETLGLQQYGLVPSKNIKDIQKYLSAKMTKALTGVDPNETDPKKLFENMKFKNRKLVDQKVFIDLYKTQIGKNALYEVSRFCFENLRKTNAKDKINFRDHWEGYTQNIISEATLEHFDDLGDPKFGKDLQDASDKNKVFQDIFQSINGAGGEGLSAQEMSAFFTDCGKIIVPLCRKFEDDPKSEKGGAACLAKNRLQEYKKALVNAEKVAEQFNEMSFDAQKSALLSITGDQPKFYGQGADDESIDDLTNNTSADIFTGGSSKNNSAEECEKKPELASCEGFISKDDSLDKVKHKIEMEMTLKREVEKARVRELVEANDKSLEKYLEDNGYFDLLAKHNKENLSADQMAEEIGKSFEAKKNALLAEIQNKLGSRQVSASAAPADIEKAAEGAVKETKEERARLSQVILFNNVITSYLTLKKKVGGGKTEDVGRNVNPWKKEEKALTASKVDPNLFANLKASNEGVSGLSKENQISGFEILDNFLGKDETK